MTANIEPVGLVVATFRRRMNIRLTDGSEVSARVKGRLLRPVCGDRVGIEPIKGESDWLITGILERQNQLTRPNTRGDIEILAANITFLIAVAANPPKPDWFIVDRYLCAAEFMGVKAAVVYNKVELSIDPEAVREALDAYRQIGYTALETSAKTGTNIAELGTLLIGETAIIVGQSGVGKSSIINSLTQNSDQRVGEVSAGSGEGRHTTVNSAMLDLPGGGSVIDSPGVRDYAPAVSAVDQVASGFKEIVLLEQDCKFANCRHLREPKCAVKHAVESGTMSQRRHESYKRLLRSTQKIAELHP
jgi:ribosome biogenesis GTPase